MRISLSHSTLMTVSALLLSASAVLAQDAPPTATPTPGTSSPFTEAKADSENPFGADKAKPQGPVSLDDAIRAEENASGEPKAASLATPEGSKDPFAENKGTLDPLTKPVATPAQSILDSPAPAANSSATSPAVVADPFADSSMPAAPMMSAPVSEAASPGAPAAASTAVADSLPWAASLDAAIAKAKAEKKGVLVVFSGETPLWDGFNAALNSPSVAPGVVRNFVPVKLDLKANEAVAKKYAVKRAPYVVVLNKFGYTAGHVQPTADAGALLALLNPFMKLG